MSERRRWWVMTGILTGMFLAALEATIIGTAMPTVVAALGGLRFYSWVFSAYLITSTVTVPVWGKLSDLYGRRLFYQIGIGLFLLGSILSGLSHTMEQLILFRALQGLGAGALVPLGMTIVGDIYTLEERARMQAFFSAVWGLASIVGPLIGGFITDKLSWRWVFYINVPFGLTAAIIMGVALKEARSQQRPKIDYAGAIVLMVAVTVLMTLLVEGGSNLEALLSPVNLSLFGATAVLLALFVWIEKRAEDPILPFDLFANRMISVATAAGFLSGITMFGAISFVPLFAQGALGDDATTAGSLLTPLLLSWVILSIIGGRLLLRIGYRPTILTGLALLTVGFMMLATYRPSVSRLWLQLDLILMGSGLGLTMLTLLLAVQQWVDRSQLGVATSLNQFARSIGGAVGVALMGATLSASLSAELQRIAHQTGSLTPQRAAALAANPNALIDSPTQSALPHAVMDALREAMTIAMHHVFWVNAVAAAIALFICLWLPSGLRKEDAPSAEDCSLETGEQLLLAELTTIDPEHEPLINETAATR